MAKFVVNPFSITYEQIQNDLRLMIAQNQSTFTDFFNDGSGSSVVDVAAALGAFFAYHVITQRKEFTLEQATSYKSLIGNAYDKGYNVSRGRNIRVNLTVTPNATGSLAAWSNIGQYADYDVTLTKDVSFTLGIPTTIEVILGNRQNESISVGTSNIRLFQLTSDDVTDDVRLFLNDTEIADYSTQITDLMNNKYLMLSNSYGSVNVFYLQKGDNQYKPGDYITIDYISRNTIDFDSISQESFYLANFTVNQMELSQARETTEAKDDIRINAALHAETAGIIRSRGDFKKVLKEMAPSIASIEDEDIQPGRIGIYILKDNLEPLTEEDKKEYQQIVKSRTVSGVANAIYEDAQKFKNTLNIELTALDNTSTESSLRPRIENDVLKYMYNIGALIDFNDIENYIEEQEGIKVARITTKAEPWEVKTYRISDTCIANRFNNKTYYVAGYSFHTGHIPPEWDTPDENGYIVDGDILWKEYEGNPEGIMIWKPYVNIALGKLVVDSLDDQKRVFECVGFNTKTGNVSPNWESEDSYLIDNNIVWEKIDSSDRFKDYKANSIYRIGEDVKVTIEPKEEGQAGKTLYFRVIDYAMPTGEQEPNWETKTAEGYIEDGDILLWAETKYPMEFVQLAKNTYSEFDINITMV